MKMRYRTFIAVVMVASAVMAQDDAITRNVTVERNYNPSTVNATKISPVPTKEDLSVEQPEVSYSLWSSSEDVTIKNDIAKADEYTPESVTDSKKGVAKVGLGFYWQTLGEFYYPLINSDKYLLDINLMHKSNWGHVKIADGTSPRAAVHNTKLNLNFESQFSTSRLFTGVDVSYNGFDYYGLSDLPKEKDIMKDTVGTYTTVDFEIGMASTNPYSTFEYDFKVGYEFLGRNFDLMQNALFAEALLAGEVGEGRLGANIALDVDMLNRKVGDEKEFEAKVLLTLNPFYTFVRERWNLTLGAKMFALASPDKKRPVTGCADIKGTFALVPELFYLNAGIGGYFDINAYADVIKMNNYITPNLIVEPTYSPLDVNVGIKTNVMKGLMFEASARYALILDQFYFINREQDGSMTNTFDVVYDNTHRVTAELGLYFTYVKNLDISLKGRYNFWGVTSIERAWQRPAWEINFDAKYTIKEKWRIGLTYNFLGGRYALVGGDAIYMNDVHDLGVTFSYQVLDFLEVFAEGKNLINIKSDLYYGYRSMGINGLAGVTFRF